MHRIVFALLLLAAPLARAEAPSAPESSHRGWAALSVGALVSQPFSEWGLAASPELTGGAFLVHGRLGVGASLAFAQLPLTGALQDARVPGGSATWRLTVQDLRVGVGAQWHFAPVDGGLSPFAGARATVHFVGARSAASAGGDLGEHREQWTAVGGTAYAGALYRLGPGVLTGALELDAMPVSQRLTGEGTLSALALRVGYGLLF